VVSAVAGRRYIGIDVRAEQLEENERQWAAVSEAKAAAGAEPPSWLLGDARDARALLGPAQADLVFSCPPYGDLERYSDDPRDLSSLPYEVFVPEYSAAVAAAVACLREDRFAVFVVAEFRAPDGFLRGFVPDTIDAFRRAGALYYNEAVLLNQAGSL